MSELPRFPCRWAERLLEWFCSDEHLEILQGDLHELYEHRQETQGTFQARLHYAKDALDMLRPFARRKRREKLKNNPITMFRNYFKISFRNMLRHKVYAGINLTGLSLGIACFLLIALYVQDELSYDRYHENADDIYRIVVENYDVDGSLSRVFGYSSPKHGEVIRDYPQVEHAVRFNPWNFPVIRYENKQFEESLFNFVEPEILDIFTFKFIEGVPEKALTEPYTVIISASAAQKYFGSEPAYGKVLQVIDGDEFLFKVTGVVEDFPEQSHMSYDFMASWVTFENVVDPRNISDYYGNYNYPTYLKLAEGAKVEDLAEQMPAMLNKYVGKIQGADASSRVALKFQKLTDIHLKGTPGGSGNNGVYYLYLFSGIGILVLVIACINYMNLSTAKYSNRLKEIGVRKVMGARARHVSQQFLTESVFYVIIALVISIGLTLLFLPTINQFTEKNLTFNPLENSSLFLFIMGLILVVGLVAGSYPSFFMSRFKTVTALKGGKILNSGKSVFRTSLVIFQFTITIGLIIAVAVVKSQLDFIHNQDPGFDRERVVTFWASPSINEQLEDFKSRLAVNPNVLDASASSRVPTGRLGDSMDATLLNGSSEEIVDFRLAFVSVDEDYMKLFDLELLAGDGFRKETAGDSTQIFLINETAAQKLGYETATEVLGQRMIYGRSKGFVGGVVKDFHFESLHSEIQPMIFLHNNGNKRVMSVKINSTNIPETMSFLEAEFLRLNPDRTFDGGFLDSSFDRQYRSEQALSSISGVFSVLAIIIACLGLLGLVGFTMEQRAKEISVRKVLGASVQSILLLVNKRYLVLIVISFTIASPIAWYFLVGWLDTFAYHIDMGPGLIVLSGLLAAVFAVITICSQALKAAIANPVHNLRNE